MLSSKIAELESGSQKDDEDEKILAKAVTQHMAELKVTLDQSQAQQQLSTLQGRYQGLYQERVKLDRELVLTKRKLDIATKDKDAALLEHQKSLAMKGKLETLCRELQRQNKQVLDDAKRQASDEHAKRQELSGKFHSTIKDISDRMEEQADERLRQLRENEMLRENLKNLKEQYQIREQHYATEMKAKDLERQLLEAKLKQQADIALQEALKAQAYKEQIASLAKTENELRNQLSLYAEKFEQFQDTLTKSNDVFTTFKQEMERMTKTIKQREKENGLLKKKSEQSDVTLIELVEERNGLKKQLDTVKAQKTKLEGLCRALQADRSTTPSTSTSSTSSSNPNPNPNQDSVDSNVTSPSPVSSSSENSNTTTPPLVDNSEPKA